MDNYTNRNLPRRARRPRRSIGLAKQQDDYGSGSATYQAQTEPQSEPTASNHERGGNPGQKSTIALDISAGLRKNLSCH
jgi:hypothetical protein